MFLKTLRTALMGALLTASMTFAAHAAVLNSRVIAVDARSHTIVTMEGKQRFAFIVTDKTRFVDGKGTLLATGLTVGEMDVLEAAVQEGYLKAGSRLSIIFDVQGNVLPASQIQFRDVIRPAEKEESENGNQK